MLAPITALYTALCGALLFVLSWRVSTTRRKTGVGLGADGNKEMEQVMRVQANLVEYLPTAMLLLLLLELNGAALWLLHGFGLSFTVARLLHAWGFSHRKGPSRGRFIGALTTYLVLLLLAVVNIAVIVLG